MGIVALLFPEQFRQQLALVTNHFPEQFRQQLTLVTNHLEASEAACESQVTRETVSKIVKEEGNLKTLFLPLLLAIVFNNADKSVQEASGLTEAVTFFEESNMGGKVLLAQSGIGTFPGLFAVCALNLDEQLIATPFLGHVFGPYRDKVCPIIRAIVKTAQTEAKVTVDNIRTVAIKKDLKLSSCEANINIDFPGWGKARASISYTSQPNSEGKIYVLMVPPKGGDDPEFITSAEYLGASNTPVSKKSREALAK